jgi:hypothetical protein
MSFDYVNFLAKNKLTSTSRLNEKAKNLLNENYIDLRPINSLREEEDLDDEDIDIESDEDEFDFTSPGKKDEFDVDDDIEPTAKDLKSGEEVVASGKQGKLQGLIKQKDVILAKLKSGQITIDQYKQEIGNIPQQIKNLQASIDQELSLGDDSEEEL